MAKDGHDEMTSTDVRPHDGPSSSVGDNDGGDSNINGNDNDIAVESSSAATPSAPPFSSAEEAADALFRNTEILAPMVRASTTPLRALALAYGADITYTEEIVDRAMTGTVRTVNPTLGTIDYIKPSSAFSAKVRKRMAADAQNNADDGTATRTGGAVLLRIDPTLEKNRLIFQMGTGESHLALPAAMMVAGDVSGIDVNMGCPKKFSVSGGMGSALLSDVGRACDVLKTLRRNLPSHMPVSAKIRLLDEHDPQPTIDFARALVKAGANAIAVHGRIVGDEAHVDARWQTLSDVVRSIKSSEGVPVIVNGDLYTREDMRYMRRRTGCDGVMLARPALYNASIFRKESADDAFHIANSGVGDAAAGETIVDFQNSRHTGRYGYTSPLLLPKTKVVQDYLALAYKYRVHPKNAKYVVCEMMSNRRAPSNRVPFLPHAYPGGQSVDKVCKCRGLDDLMTLWDVRLTATNTMTAAVARVVAMTASAATGGKQDGESSGGMEAGGEHRYDDRYFLDHDRYRQESANNNNGNNGASKDDEKKVDECKDGKGNQSPPPAKRCKQ